MALNPGGALRKSQTLLQRKDSRVVRIHSGFGVKRDSWLADYVSTHMRPVMWRVYQRDDAETRKHEELFQGWKGIVDFTYRRPHGQVQHPKWMRQLFAKKKYFELDAETNTEKIYLGFTANYIWSHWSRKGTSIPPVQLLETALSQAKTVKDLGYATKMLRSYRQYFNVHMEHNIFTAYMSACLRVGCPDCALYALNQARWLGFASVKEQDRAFLQGNLPTHPSEGWTYEEHVKTALEEVEKSGNKNNEPIAEVQDFTPFAKFWRSHDTEQGWWVYPWDKDPDTKIIKHFWRHPDNVDPRHGTAYTEWTAYGTPLSTDAYGVPTDPLGEEAIKALVGEEEDPEDAELAA
eukprot:TRINITY_DN2219_c2_g2_i2.p1 TRINITY_DN2219_c2_g2~~TRINITY_DN2219_c2_g2_i2.p1  ORF type:complete len:366 (+),score=72.33 TRINITY_DN2219_c2_g2_i2:52-1098(+)